MAVYERRDLHGARPLPVPGGVPGPQLRGRHLLQPVPEQGQVHPGRRRVPTPHTVTHRHCLWAKIIFCLIQKYLQFGCYHVHTCGEHAAPGCSGTRVSVARAGTAPRVSSASAWSRVSTAARWVSLCTVDIYKVCVSVKPMDRLQLQYKVCVNCNCVACVPSAGV